MSEEDPLTALVKEYINICNYVLVEHKDRFPLSEIVSLADRVFGTDDIAFKIVDDHGGALAYYTTRYGDGQFAPIRGGEDNPDAVFSIPKAHLQDVVDNAGDYMAHPAKLDLAWLRVGLESLIP
jgi:hypothetical protein